MLISYNYKEALQKVAELHRNAVVLNSRNSKRVILLMSLDTLERLKEAATETEFSFTEPDGETFEAQVDFWYPLTLNFSGEEYKATAGCPVRIAFLPHMQFRAIAEDGNYN